MGMWINDYSPSKKYEQIIGINADKMYEFENNPTHLLFHGHVGTGKTTLAKMIIRRMEANYIILNASDERGIGVIRDKVKQFAMTKSSNNQKKIVLLDEADALTKDAQNSLRNIMETYYKNCFFILTGNYFNKFIPAIVSRCIVIEFSNIDKKQIINRLMFIISKENVKIQLSVLNSLVEKFYPDIRKIINKLQELSTLNREITKNDIKKEELLIDDLFLLLKQKNFTEARKLLLDNNVDYDSLTLSLYYWTFKSKLESSQKIKIIQLLCEVSKYLNVVISKELLFADFLIRTIIVLR